MYVDHPKSSLNREEGNLIFHANSNARVDNFFYDIFIFLFSSDSCTDSAVGKEKKEAIAKALHHRNL